VALHDLAHDPETQPRAGTLQGVLVGRAEQRGEEVGLVGLGDADALVTAGEDHATVGQALDAEPDLVAGVGVLHGVVDQVADRAGDLAGIGVHDRRAGLPDELQRDARLLRDGRHRPERLVDDRHQVDPRHGRRVVRVADA
jgi:hypothetical protein